MIAVTLALSAPFCVTLLCVHYHSWLLAVACVPLVYWAGRLTGSIQIPDWLREDEEQDDAGPL